MAKKEKTGLLNQMFQTSRTARTILARNLLDIGLYAGQDAILLALSDRNGQTPTTLAAQIGVRAPTITKTINRLEAQGFVTRIASKDDARQVHIWLTVAGADTLKAIRKAARKTEKHALSGLTKKDRKAFSALLATMSANMGQDRKDDAAGSSGAKASDRKS